MMASDIDNVPLLPLFDFEFVCSVDFLVVNIWQLGILHMLKNLENDSLLHYLQQL